MHQSTLSFEQFSASCLARDSEQIAHTWIDTLSSQLGIRPRRVLPHEELYDHLPAVLGKVAEFLVTSDAEKLTAEQLVLNDMRNIARLRRKQGYDVQEIIREFDELARILDSAAIGWIEEYPDTPDPKAVGRVFGRLNRAPLLMGEITVGTYQEEEIQTRFNTAHQLRNFTDMLLHELKTPLGAAEGAALLLQNEEITKDAAERRRFASLIQRNLSRARTVVDDVRAMSLVHLAQAHAGRFLPIGEVLGEMLAEIRPLSEATGVRIEVQEPVPDLMVDASRVEVVLLNLISNGAKYSDPARTDRWVRVSFQRQPGAEEWWVEVADNGLGIPREMHEQIFNRFVRVHPEAAAGTGLGLPIVREAIQQLNSRLEFDSEPGRGTTFRFTLPRPAQEMDVE